MLQWSDMAGLDRNLDWLEQTTPDSSSHGRRAEKMRFTRLVANRLFVDRRDYRRFFLSNTQHEAGALADYLFAVAGEPSNPREVFGQLRWGGQFIFMARRARQAEHQAAQFDEASGFILERPPQRIDLPRRGLRIPFLRPSLYYFVARKVALLPAGQYNMRYSYDVRLVPTDRNENRYMVEKRIPSDDTVYRRLKHRFPRSTEEMLHAGTRRLIDHVFPVLLTREAAFLMILARDLPTEYAGRFPHLLHMEQDDGGIVREMHINWLPLGGERLSHLEFARQCADLLRVMHDHVGIIHLDLRLDNVLVTEQGVGFIDFGSAVRIGEDLGDNPTLKSMYKSMMSTSKIQRVLGKMIGAGRITSHPIRNSHMKIDKGVDLFYLSLQMNRPLSNPDFKGLVYYDPHAAEARYLARLTEMVLRPQCPEVPRFGNAKDLLDGIVAIGTHTLRDAHKNAQE